MAKPKDVEQLKDKTTANRFTRTFTFNEQLYFAFEKELDRRGSSPGQMFKKMVNDYLDGRYITTDNLPETTIHALQKLATEQRTHFANAIDSALNEWATAHAKKK